MSSTTASESVQSTSNPLKRKSPSEGESSQPQTPRHTLPSIPPGEYETGRVICEVCGAAVSFRDTETNGFTLKHWDAHRVNCVAPGLTHSPVIYTPESTANALANPPPKRRRAKRTEEERIEYLRADPYVGQFEAYRVLCASCDKWIRLRPNSTYCSIPWDAHRKSCLSKKISSKNVYALEERNTLFEKDPDVRKFDAERVLCNICDRWLSINPNDHLQAVQKWLQHRSSCQRHPESAQSNSAPPPSEQYRTLAPSSSLSLSSSQHRPTPTSRSDPPSPSSRFPSSSAYPQSSPQLHQSHQSPPPSFYHHHHDPSSATFTSVSAHESRRRNAEQRAATLRSDTLIAEVEPNRVFCSLCQKWVQLRQDSSYCAYPWLQHRGKCLARYQRRVQKSADVAEFKARRLHADGGFGHRDRGHAVSDADLSSSSSSDDDEPEPESEEGVDYDVAEAESSARREAERRQFQVRRDEPWRKGKGVQRDVDARADGDFEERESERARIRASPPTRPVAKPSSFLARRVPRSLADLDSPSGRKQFIFVSVEYLFTTTYESSDDMSISALLTYLNAAMPQDKHEDFDTGEVVRAAAALQEKGRIAFEGDMLRLLY